MTWVSIVPALQAEAKGKEVAALAAERDLGNFCHVIFHEIILKINLIRVLVMHNRLFHKTIDLKPTREYLTHLV